MRFKKGYIGKWLALAGILIAGYMVYVIIAGIIPYTTYLDVDQKFAQQQDVSDYYGTDEWSMDRVGLIEEADDGLGIRLHMIDSAEQTLEISYYSTHWGESTELFFGSLLDAADRGVRVKFILDGVANNLRKDAKQAAYALALHPNIELKLYNEVQLLKPWTFNGRLHDKYIIVDNKLLLLGGRNIGDKYFNDEESAPTSSMDRDVFVYNTAHGMENGTGSVIHSVKRYFADIWGLEIATAYSKLSDAKQQAGYTEMERLRNKFLSYKTERRDIFQEAADYRTWTVPANKVSFIHNPIHTGRKEPLIWYRISSLLLNAKQSVVMQSPYVILNDSMETTLMQIGEDVETYTMLTNSIATSPNVLAYSGYLRDRKKLISAGADVYEYQGTHSIHGKSYLIDDDMALVGSYNLDIRSTYINTEIMLVIHSREFNQLLDKRIQAYQEKSLVLNPDNKYEMNSDVTMKEVSTMKRVLVQTLSYISGLYRFLL